MKRTIWVVEDDEDVCFVYSEILAQFYNIEFYHELGAFERSLSSCTDRQLPHLIIADIRLRDESFVQFIQNQKNRMILAKIPTIVISSVDDVHTLRFCFANGANEYLTKPFNRSELIIRIERLIASHKLLQDGFKQIGDLALDTASLRLRNLEQVSEELTSKEFQIISVMFAGSESRASRDEIIDRIWGGRKVCQKALDVHLSNLRKKLALIGVRLHYSSGIYALESESSMANNPRSKHSKAL